MKGVIAGVIAGFVGALVWAFIVVFTGYEIGWLAWGIGAVVGGAVAWGTEGSKVNGLIAVVIAVAAILGGKLASVEIAIAREVKSANAEVKQGMDADDEYMKAWLAWGIVASYEAKGMKIEWPEGVDPEEASEKKDYPGMIWGMAESAWASMSDEGKANLRREVETEVTANIKAYAASIRGEGFIESFSGFDVIFILLAVMTAFKVASNAGSEGAAESVAETDDREGLNDQ